MIHLFQTIILGIHVSFRVCTFTPISTNLSNYPAVPWGCWEGAWRGWKVVAQDRSLAAPTCHLKTCEETRARTQQVWSNKMYIGKKLRRRRTITMKKHKQQKTSKKKQTTTLITFFSSISTVLASTNNQRTWMSSNRPPWQVPPVAWRCDQGGDVNDDKFCPKKVRW